ncbi:RNA polymerase sigma factor [Leifsonia xyli]|uniref:RNA polymerase sigma factor n=1 Tax=Leifsonia xyli TaxID=1575 RepID=UPI003D66CECD
MTATAVRPTDLELLQRVRLGDRAAFGELWNRYQGWAHHLARTTTHRFDPEDIVQEAFAKVLRSLRNGNGPTEGFAQYLRIAVRTVASSWGRASRARPSCPSPTTRPSGPTSSR